MNQAGALTLRPFSARDAQAVAGWPAYPPEFAELDYALRPGGWLTAFFGQPASHVFAAELAGELIAFSLLAGEADGNAEFRVALHPLWLGRGYGRAVTEATLGKGFGDLGLSRIDLVVRRKNRRAIALYRQLGFACGGECSLLVNGRLTDFHRMHLEPDQALFDVQLEALDPGRTRAADDFVAQFDTPEVVVGIDQAAGHGVGQELAGVVAD